MIYNNSSEKVDSLSSARACLFFHGSLPRHSPFHPPLPAFPFRLRAGERRRRRRWGRRQLTGGLVVLAGRGLCSPRRRRRLV